MVHDLTVFALLWCGFALLGGGLIKGTLGVGTPLLTVPLMAMVLPAQAAVVIMAVPVVVANIWQILHAPNLPQTLKRFWPAAASLILCTGFGSAVLSVINERLLLTIVGCAVILFAVLQIVVAKPWLNERLRVPAGIVFGALSGLIGGVSSMFGPMLVIYLVSLKGLEKEEFVGAISFLYICAVLPWTVSLMLFGLLNQSMLQMSALATLPVVAGLIIGQKIRRRLSHHRFQQLIIIILVCSGCSMLLQAFSASVV